MKALILAAGRGSRMKDATAELPKCLLKINGKPLINHQIEALNALGISNIAVVTGYMAEKLTDLSLMQIHNSKWYETNMVSSMFCAFDWMRTDECIVSYSDIFYPPSCVATLINNSEDISITYDTNWKKLWSNRFSDPLSDAETFRINENSYVTEIGKKPKTLDEIQGQYMGLLKFSPVGLSEARDTFEALDEEKARKVHMTGLLQKIINRGKVKIYGCAVKASWGEVDTQTDLAFYNETREIR